MSVYLNILSLMFVIAKILGPINWSWWLIFTPTYIYLVLVLISFVVIWKEDD